MPKFEEEPKKVNNPEELPELGIEPMTSWLLGMREKETEKLEFLLKAYNESLSKHKEGVEEGLYKAAMAEKRAIEEELEYRKEQGEK